MYSWGQAQHAPLPTTPNVIHPTLPISFDLIPFAKRGAAPLSNCLDMTALKKIHIQIAEYETTTRLVNSDITVQRNATGTEVMGICSETFKSGPQTYCGLCKDLVYCDME